MLSKTDRRGIPRAAPGNGSARAPRRGTAAALRGILAAAALLAAGGAAAQTAAAAPDLGTTLQGVLAYARQANPELRATRLEADAAADRVRPAGALRDPFFEMELRNITNDGTGGGFSLSPANVGSTKYTLLQTFPPWGSRDARRNAAQASAEAAASQVDVTWAELALRIKTAYARYRQATASLVQTGELLQLVTQLEAVAQARYAGGLAAQQDAIRAQVERTAAQTEVAMLEAELASVRARLNGLLARPADAPLAPPQPGDALPPIAALDAAALRERLLERNPQLKAEDARIRAAEGGKDAVYANRYPEFGIGVSPIQRGSRLVEWDVKFVINIPLQQGSRRGDEREALALLAAAQARRESVLNEALAQLGESRAAFEAARRIETLTASALLPQAEATLQSALAGYESGKVDFATVLDAQRQIRQARLTLIRTRAEARVRLAEIERWVGEDL